MDEEEMEIKYPVWKKILYSFKAFFSSSFYMLLIIFGVSLISLGLNLNNPLLIASNSIIAIAALRCLGIVHKRDKENSGTLLTNL